MNANELAFHSLIVRLNGAGYYEAATMLRQQQSEIEKLKDEVAEWKMSYENNIRFEDGYGHN